MNDLANKREISIQAPTAFFLPPTKGTHHLNTISKSPHTPPRSPCDQGTMTSLPRLMSPESFRQNKPTELRRRKQKSRWPRFPHESRRYVFESKGSIIACIAGNTTILFPERKAKFTKSRHRTTSYFDLFILFPHLFIFVSQRLIDELFATSPTDTLTIKDFENVVVKVVGVSKYLTTSLAARIDPKALTISKTQFVNYWRNNLQNKTSKERCFQILKKNQNNYLEPDDFKSFMKSDLFCDLNT